MKLSTLLVTAACWFGAASIAAGGSPAAPQADAPIVGGSDLPELPAADHDETGAEACSLSKRLMCVKDVLEKFEPHGNDPGWFDTRAGNDTNTDLTHYDLDITINYPTSQTISGSNTITFTSLVNGLTTFPIQLSNNFTISAITSNGVSTTFTRVDSANVTVNLDRAS